MSLKKFRFLFLVFITAIIGFVLHKTIFYFFVPNIYENSFVYSTALLYAFFAIFSTIIIFILIQIKERSIDNVGYTFLFLTSLKMVVAYIFLRPILSVNFPKTPTEKINFFIIFIYFLAIETIATIRILNNKQ
jgi:hypothetical protein